MTSKAVRHRLSFMRNRFPKLLVLVGVLLLVSASVWAHHGTATSYDTKHVWSTWATVVEYRYLNPHPSLAFDRVDKNGNVEHWESEAGNNPSQLARAGWTKSRSAEALKPGTRVKLYLATALAGGHTAVVEKMENEKGEAIVSEKGEIAAIDLDGVPDGYQPKLGGGK